MSGLKDRLRACTVRINIGGAAAGSGFFIAPGHVVTCEHVLRPATAASGAPKAIEISDVKAQKYDYESITEISPEEDLAIMRVTPSESHPCVLLVPGQRLHDRVLSFGYPQNRRVGATRTLKAEGETGDDKLLILKGGQVQPGMSGSPLLNERTGGVCGVLSWTRDAAQDIGGYAIPVERLLDLSPDMESQNEGYHKVHRDWVDDLTTDQQLALPNIQLGATAGADFSCKFVISVHGKKDNWKVSATLYPGGKLPPKPAEVQTVREEVARVFRDWAARGRSDPGGVSRGRFEVGEDVRLLGGILFEAVLPGMIEERFTEMLSADEGAFELALHFADSIPPEFQQMPWEYLHVAARGVMGEVHVAAAEELAFVRVLESAPGKHNPPRARLSALMVGVTPPGYRGRSPVDEVLEDALATAENLDGLDLHTLVMPTPADLKRKVERVSYDIVHYVGFGKYFDRADQLALGPLPGAPDYEYRAADTFARLVAGKRRPRAVVLQEIEGPANVVPADFSVFAWRLLKAKVEAVVAYQFPLESWLSIAFNGAFYEQLAAGDPFQVAVQKARAELWMAEPNRYAFLSPAAFVDHPGELRLKAATDSAPIARVGVGSSRASPTR